MTYICYRCCQPTEMRNDGRVTDRYGSELCLPGDDPMKTHAVREHILFYAMVKFEADRPTAVWNALAALIRAEGVPPNLRRNHIKSAMRLLAAGRAEA